MKKLFLTLGIIPFALSSCGAGSASFYGKTFVLKGTYDTLDEVIDPELKRTNRMNLTEYFSNIDWERSDHFEDHSSVSAVIKEMETKSAAAFKVDYGTDFSIVINDKESGFATVYSGSQSTGYKTQLSDSGSYMNLNDASGNTEYVMYHVASNNGNFTKVGISKNGYDVKQTFTFYYTSKISGLDGVQVFYWGNFLPR